MPTNFPHIADKPHVTAPQAAYGQTANYDLRRDLRMVNLQELSARDLDPLIREETQEWAEKLDWDLSKSAELLLRFADKRELAGVAVIDGGEVAGFGYFGLSEQKAHIGDVYVRQPWRNGDSEERLFHVLFNSLKEAPRVHRIESQLLLASTRRRAVGLKSFERLLMKAAADTPLPPSGPDNGRRFCIEPWQVWGDERHIESAATVLWISHVGHMDNQISDQYRSFKGARQFAQGLVQFPGSAAFSPAASFVAYDQKTRQVAGVSLVVSVADDVAHVAELCVMPQSRGAGLGYELLRQSISQAHALGAKRISLTVTAQNQQALQLYTRHGFRESHRFYAYAWDRSVPQN